MIEYLHIRNFKCLRDVKVHLSPFTVLIGPNDSGKSSLLDAIQALGKTTTGGMRDGLVNNHLLDRLVWKRQKQETIRWHAKGKASNQAFDYLLEVSALQGIVDERLIVDGREEIRLEKGPQQRTIKSSGQSDFQLNPQDIWNSGLQITTIQQGHSKNQLVTEALSSTEKYSLDPDELRKQGTLSTPGPFLAKRGEHFVAVLDSIFSSPDVSIRTELEKALHEAVPSLNGIALPIVQGPGGPTKTLEFGLSGGSKPIVTIPASQVSDGAILLTAFLALAYGNTPQILLIEEPENGLHPSRLKLVIDLLQKMATGEIGNKPRQIILTTHSPLLLNYVKPEQVRIFQRDLEKGTTVTSMSEAPDIEKLLTEFGTGELWFMLGEEALVNGAKE